MANPAPVIESMERVTLRGAGILGFGLGIEGETWFRREDGSCADGSWTSLRAVGLRESSSSAMAVPESERQSNRDLDGGGRRTEVTGRPRLLNVKM